MDLHTQNEGIAPVLRSARLVLRPLDRGDFDDIVRLVGDYDVSKMLTHVPYPYSMSDAEHFFAMDQADELDMLWMITHQDELVGAISIGSELGYWLGQDHWGQGIMTEAGVVAIDAYFGLRDVSEIKASHFVGNDGSRRVLEKLGFIDIGGHEHFSQARQQKVAGRQMQLTRDAWDRLRTAAQ